MEERERREAQGKRVKMARAGAGLSRQKMADHVSERWEKISREYIRRIEEGEVDPGYGFFIAAAEVTNQTVEWFIAVNEAPIFHGVLSNAISSHETPSESWADSPIEALDDAA